MPEKNLKLSKSETKRKKRAELYFDLFPEKKPQQLPNGERMMDIKKRNRQCKECDPIDLVLGIGEKWMCFDCKHSPYREDEWI
nr:hypothetical protein [uncultured Mediterranean phage uvMED]